MAPMKKTNQATAEIDLNVLLGVRHNPKPPRARGRLPQLNKFYLRMAAAKRNAELSAH